MKSIKIGTKGNIFAQGGISLLTCSFGGTPLNANMQSSSIMECPKRPGSDISYEKPFVPYVGDWKAFYGILTFNWKGLTFTLDESLCFVNEIQVGIWGRNE